MPVPVYTSSPITAPSKASAITPQTALPEDSEQNVRPQPTTTSPQSSTAYPPAQPGARPSLPVETGVPQLSDRYKPTSTDRVDASPPPPQPGAMPSPPGKSSLPPPPKAGETLQQSQAQTMPMPPQMSYPPPTTTYAAHGGTSSSTSTAYSPNVPQPTFLQGRETTEPDFSHPPGYQQNANAADFTRDQREAYNASVNQDYYEANEEDSIWNTAKKWAAAAGDSIAAAENEVWKRINKD
ncbi:uncharacterized protein TRIREDRAFT_3889 [Trichoderma reesei QM6a]|uniref:Predicted protein n=2 Tax=Hypocrea jecorina TaxID=51453 RepID=G0RJ91_HYPJQ|nr:uncharacterized protein TRIREDRAFT_3889 [Trichoderma reesei QM6a]EGR48549.1 predicted protein [Trichoderma reesei QM6a]ETS01407.1 hypothetical protein M419DRAFT_80821 [Trichoderma reesei RUT C-30]